MDKQAAPILAKSSPSGGSLASVRKEHANDHCIYGENCPLYAENPPFNAETLAALQEASDIMSGKVPGKWHRFSSKENARKELRETLIEAMQETTCIFRPDLNTKCGTLEQKCENI